MVHKRKAFSRFIPILVLILLSLATLSACTGIDKFEKTPAGSKELTYLGKYYTEHTSFSGKSPVVYYNYYLVFKLLNDNGVATPIKVAIEKDMYHETQMLVGELKADFHTDGFNNVYMTIGKQYFSVEDYIPEKANPDGVLKDYDFVDQLYVPKE